MAAAQACRCHVRGVGGPIVGKREDASRQREQERRGDDTHSLAIGHKTNLPPSTQPPPPALDLAAVALTFSFPALGGALFGYDIGATSGALPSLRGALSGAAWASALTPVQAGAVVSSSLVGALLGSALAFAVGDKIGRKAELVAAGGLYAAAATAAATAPGLAPLLAARALYGVAIGLAMHSAPSYISETAPASVRGLLISLKEGAIVGGILAGYVAASGWGGDAGGWRLMYGAAAIPGAMLAIGTALFAPDSPRWLLLAGKGEERARSALARCRGRAAVDAPASVAAEFDDMTAAATAARADGAGAPSLSDLVTQPRYRTPLLIGLSLVLMQQITGQPSVLYYAASIFEAAGFGGDASTVAVGLGLFKLVATGAAVATVERAGRRPLLIGGVTAMTAALSALAVATATGGGSAGAYASLAALLLYVGAYQVGREVFRGSEED